MPRRLLPAVLLSCALASNAMAGPMTEDFSTAPETRWDYVSDRVMGGVSDGQAAFVTDGGATFVRLTGDVSTDNNGGFIQVRTRLTSKLPADMTALRLRTRGNGEEYYVHIRTSDTRIPWFYYQAPFTAQADWQDITIPLTAFAPSTAAIPQRIAAEKITSIGIVAYGRDHTADISVARIESQ